jgi:hypothetical protein
LDIDDVRQHIDVLEYALGIVANTVQLIDDSPEHSGHHLEHARADLLGLSIGVDNSRTISFVDNLGERFTGIELLVRIGNKRLPINGRVRDILHKRFHNLTNVIRIEIDALDLELSREVLGDVSDHLLLG